MKVRKLTCEALESRSVLSATLLWHPLLPTRPVDAHASGAMASGGATQLGAPAEIAQPLAAVSSRDAALWPFAADSPWNIGMGTGAVYVAETSPGFSPTGGANLNVTNWSWPVYQAQDTDPLVSVYWSGDSQPTATIRIPAGANPDPQSDHSLIVIAPDHKTIVEMWNASWSGTTKITAGVVYQNDIEGQGFYSSYHGARAGGMSAFGGLLRKDELAAANIPHALAVAVSPNAMNRNAPGGKPYVWPANHADGTTGSGYGTSGNLYMGSLLAIPPSVNLAGLGLSVQGLAVGLALQNYGAYITEQAGANIAFYAEAAASSVIASALQSDLATLTRYLQVVTNNSATNVNGGGSRFVDPSPAFGSGDPTPDPDPDPTPDPDPPPVVQVFTISGTVTNSRGRVLSNVKVHLFTEAGDYLKTVTTNRSGQYTISEVKPGTYKVASDGGFGSRSWTDKLVTVIDGNVLNVSLSVRRR